MKKSNSDTGLHFIATQREVVMDYIGGGAGPAAAARRVDGGSGTLIIPFLSSPPRHVLWFLEHLLSRQKSPQSSQSVCVFIVNQPELEVRSAQSGVALRRPAGGATACRESRLENGWTAELLRRGTVSRRVDAVARSATACATALLQLATARPPALVDLRRRRWGGQ